MAYQQVLQYKPTDRFNIPAGILGMFTKNQANRNLQNQMAIAAQQDINRGVIPGTPQYAQKTGGVLLADAAGGRGLGGGTTTPQGQIAGGSTDREYFGDYLDQDAYGNPIGTTYDAQGNIVHGTVNVGGNETQGAITGETEIPGVDWFSYDWEGEQQKAYEALKPFYEKLLEFTNGRLDLAKRVLEYTYQSGMREAKQTYEFDKGQLDELFPEETKQLVTNLNKRGVYFSGFGEEDRGTLGKSQDRRRLAVERALEGRTSDLEKAREFGLEEKTKQTEEERFNLERQKRKEADEMAANKYGIESTKFEAQLKKQEQAEGRNTQAVANQTLMGAIGGGSTRAATSKPSEPTGKTTTIGGVTGKLADNNMLYGGWYKNPASGKTQRYWGSGYWTDN